MKARNSGVEFHDLIQDPKPHQTGKVSLQAARMNREHVEKDGPVYESIVIDD
jgi:hypothetical protein